MEAATIVVTCPRCRSDRVYRHGKARSGEQRYRCRDCHPCFQRHYRYEANKPDIKKQLVDMETFMQIHRFDPPQMAEAIF